jgi:hypothetical protein
MADPTREQNITPIDFDSLPTLDEAVPTEPHDPDHINPKVAADIRYWAHQFNVSAPRSPRCVLRWNTTMSA